jgi:gamma-glutamyltranspeptidase/glutathione hydrolase
MHGRFFDVAAAGKVIRFDRSNAGDAPSAPRDAVVATAYPHATQAAREILEAGGNAVDAAVAAAWALSVCEPSGSGLGGQTTLIIHRCDGATVVVDGHSRAPAKASLARISASQQASGYRACTIPSTPATLGFAQHEYGALSAQRVLEPAIALAENGYPLSRLQRRQIRSCLAELRVTGSHRVFFERGRLLREGQLLKQPALAATLERLADAGHDDFYHGRLARRIARDMKAHGGLITRRDLAAGALPVEREPIAVDYRDYRVLGVPPPGGGVQLLQALKIIERLAPDGFAQSDDAWYETMADVVYAVFAFRERWPVHATDFTPSVHRWLLGDALAGEIADAIRRTTVHEPLETGSEPPGDTTHLSVADAHGNVVALTQSVQSLFGSKVAHPKLGFFYNNYLVTCPRYRHPSQLAGGCMPRSNVTPTLVMTGGSRSSSTTGDGQATSRPVLAIGAAGSRRIISATLQVLSGILDRGLSADEAMAAPRIHALLNGNVWIEKTALSDTLRERLCRRYRRLKVKRPLSYAMGAVQAVQCHDDGSASAAADPRRDGSVEILAAAESPTGDRP